MRSPDAKAPPTSFSRKGSHDRIRIVDPQLLGCSIKKLVMNPMGNVVRPSPPNFNKKKRLSLQFLKTVVKSTKPILSGHQLWDPKSSMYGDCCINHVVCWNDHKNVWYGHMACQNLIFHRIHEEELGINDKLEFVNLANFDDKLEPSQHPTHWLTGVWSI